MAQNPFRSEADAYRFLLLTIRYFALIVAASFINRWLGLAVFVALTAVAVWVWAKSRSDEPPERVVVRDTQEGERRILVCANETVGGGALLDVLRRKAEGVREEILVVVPALNTPLRHWVSDDDAARAAAQERLAASLARLREEGIDARGEVGDGGPLALAGTEHRQRRAGALRGPDHARRRRPRRRGRPRRRRSRVALATVSR